MLEIDNSRFIFKTKRIWFSEVPFDITGYDGVTFFECSKDVDVKGFSKEKFTTLIIDLTQDLDTIWKKMDRNSCRKPITKAMEAGVITKINQEYETFLKICSEFRREKGLGDYTLTIDFMKKNGILIVSEYEGKIIGGEFHISDGKNIRGVLGGSLRLEETGIMRTLVSNANRLRFWEIIVYGKKMGMNTFDMGGYYTGKKPDPQKEGINKFKKSFGGELVTHYIYEKDYSLLLYFAKKILLLKYLLLRSFFHE
jgi:hypothetical protein